MTAPACCLCIAPFINLLQPCSPPQYDQAYIASLRYLIYTSGFVYFGFFYLWDSSPVSGFASVCHQALPSASKCHSIYHLILWFQQLAASSLCWFSDPLTHSKGCMLEQLCIGIGCGAICIYLHYWSPASKDSFICNKPYMPDIHWSWYSSCCFRRVLSHILWDPNLGFYDEPLAPSKVAHFLFFAAWRVVERGIRARL